MSKIKKITISNLKAISSLTADFGGCTAMITGRNNSGKSTALKALPERIRGIKPEIILKHNETEGFAEWVLTTGEIFRWSFDSKTKAGEKLVFITKDNVKSSVTREISARYFPPTFDVDKFLSAAPKQQKETLQKLVGLDFTDIDARYKKAYDERTSLNRIASEEEIKFSAMPVPEKVAKIEIVGLQSEMETARERFAAKYKENQQVSINLRKLWLEQCEDMRKNVEEFNKLQTSRRNNHADAVDAVNILKRLGYKGLEVADFIHAIAESIEQDKIYKAPPEPDYIKEMPDDSEIVLLQDKINNGNETNRKASLYNDWVTAKGKAALAVDNARIANDKVQEIEDERMNLIKSAKMPTGFSFNEDGILYNDLPFTREQLSSSGIYIAALKLAAMTLGEVKTLHFDASFLDKNSLLEIEQWANENDLQLLIERPDFEGGEIEYHLLTTEEVKTND